MPKLMLYFSGTGNESFKFVDNFEKYNGFNEDVVRIYFKGCQHENVGGSMLFPDLDIAADKIRAAFDGSQLNLDALKDSFGDAIHFEPQDAHGSVEIESIALCGFSRGAVTTFATAKKLDPLNISIDIIADQPVPGQISEGNSNTAYQKYQDLTGCKNIRSARVLLGNYHMENNLLQTVFFQQMVPQFNEKTDSKNIMFPHQNHLGAGRHHFLSLNIHKQLRDQGYSVDMPEIMQDHSNESLLEMHYEGGEFYFTPTAFSQPIFGAEKSSIVVDPIYSAMIISKAETLSGTQGLNYTQAHAIVAVSKVDPLENKKDLYNLICQNTSESKKFIKIVNQVHDTTEYLVGRIRDTGDKKVDLIREKSMDYTHTLYQKSYDYLSKKNPSNEDKKAYVSAVNQAEQKYVNEALNQHRGLAKPILKFLTNAVLHITGAFLLVNTLHHAYTGQWKVLNDTQSTKIAKKSLNEIKEILRNDNKEEDKENQSLSVS